MVSQLSPSESHRKLLQKWSVALKIMPLVMLIAVLKFTSHSFGLEIMELNALFTSLVAGTIFLIGFQIRDLDNPFDYSNKGETGTEVSLKPFHDFENDLENF